MVMEAYDPKLDDRLEHDACGVGAIVDLKGRPSHRTVSDALTIVERLAHRAGRDAEGTTGDGVGILTQLPHSLFRHWAQETGLPLGEEGSYAAGMLFLPKDEAGAQKDAQAFEAAVRAQGMEMIAWRDVPVRPELLGRGALEKIRPDAVVLELASEPGFDLALANELGLHALAAPGLPGKTAPLAAAELMRDVIFTAIREREENDGT